MKKFALRKLLKDVKNGKISLNRAAEHLREFIFEDLGALKIDHHRALRKGFPEVVLGEGKSAEMIIAAAGSILKKSDKALITRVSVAQATAIKKVFPDACWSKRARAILISTGKKNRKSGVVAVVSGGTADIPVAEEAAVVAEAMDVKVFRVYDVGVAGLHRLLHFKKALLSADAVVAVAGMEGALPSVVAGLVPAPVIAVPTSTGYGVGLKGLAALGTMLSSCSPGLSVVNIDNGFGAGYLAGIIARRANKYKR